MSGMDLLLHAAGYTSAGDNSVSSSSSTGSINSSAKNNNCEKQKQSMKDSLYSNFVSAITFRPSCSSNSKALTRSGSNMSLPPKKRMKLSFHAAQSSVSMNNMTSNKMFQLRRSEPSLSTLGHSIMSNGPASHCFSESTDSPTLNSEWTTASLQKSTGNNNVFKSLGLTNNMIITKNKTTSSSSGSKRSSSSKLSTKNNNKRKTFKPTATKKKHQQNKSDISSFLSKNNEDVVKDVNGNDMFLNITR